MLGIQFTDLSPVEQREIHMEVHISIEPPQSEALLPSNLNDTPTLSHNGPIYVFVSVSQ